MGVVLPAITAGALVLLVVLERVAPAFERTGGRARLVRNGTLGVLGLVVSFAVVTPLSLWASLAGPGWREGWWLLPRLLTDLVLLEFYLYWWHRANHEIPFLWRFHSVHHYDEFLDVSSAVRFHPGELAMSAVLRAGLVLLFDVSAVAILVFDASVLIAAGFHHSNLALPEGIDRQLRTVIVSPEHHRIHHRPGRLCTDSNYGTLSTVSDRVFGTFRDRAPASPERRYGVSGEGEKDVLGLVLSPFRSMGSG
jgi:sterol desaturase/sphingolipid hydroxylase (fatty acid hydroxylase superfamily)